MLLWIVILIVLLSLFIGHIYYSFKNWDYCNALLGPLFIILFSALIVFIIGSVAWRGFHEDELSRFHGGGDSIVILKYCVENDDYLRASPYITAIEHSNSWLESAKKDNKKFYEIMIPDEVDSLEPYDLSFAIKNHPQAEKVP